LAPREAGAQGLAPREAGAHGLAPRAAGAQGFSPRACATGIVNDDKAPGNGTAPSIPTASVEALNTERRRRLCLDDFVRSFMTACPSWMNDL